MPKETTDALPHTWVGGGGREGSGGAEVQARTRCPEPDDSCLPTVRLQRRNVLLILRSAEWAARQATAADLLSTKPSDPFS